MSHLPFILFVCGGVAGAIITRKLTSIAALTGGSLATLIYLGVGWIGVALMGAFFLLGSFATSWKRKDKIAFAIVTDDKGPRNTGQVLANGGMAAVLALLTVLFPSHTSVLLLMLAAAFSSATADTVSSELGTIYGKKFYDVLSFKKGQRGADGVISLEGTILGLLGSFLIGMIYSISEGWSYKFLWILIAGTIGNFSDSYLGATMERKCIIGNNAVNFLNTAVAVFVILFLTII